MGLFTGKRFSLRLCPPGEDKRMSAGIGKWRGPARPPGGLAGWQCRGPAGAWFDVEVMAVELFEGKT